MKNAEYQTPQPSANKARKYKKKPQKKVAVYEDVKPRWEGIFNYAHLIMVMRHT